MSLQVLVIEDYQPNRKAIGEVIRSHGLTGVEVGDIAAAKVRLSAGGIHFCILDLGIPADDAGDGVRRENGRLLLQWMRKQACTATLPVIVVTGEDQGDTEFAVSVVTAGGSDLTQYVRKPLAGEKLDQKISWAMDRCGPSTRTLQQPFAAEARAVEVHEDKILFLGAEVWHDTGQDDAVRNAWAILSQRDQHGFVRRKGTELGATLKRDPTNHISTPMNRVLDACVTVATRKGIACERSDLMENKQGGYHFREEMRVTIIGEWAQELGIEPTPPHTTGRLPEVASVIASSVPRLSERQRRIHDLQSSDPSLSIDQIAKRLKVSRATVVRDKKGMAAV